MTVSPKVRTLVLERDGRACVCCGRSIIGQRYSLQHRVRRGLGGSRVSWIDQPQNLITVLGSGTTLCHARMEKRGQADKDRGYWIPANPEIDPRFVPVVVVNEFGEARVWLTPEGGIALEPPAAPTLPFDCSGTCGACDECLTRAAFAAAMEEDAARYGTPRDLPGVAR
jgi:hypothetical protein